MSKISKAIDFIKFPFKGIYKLDDSQVDNSYEVVLRSIDSQNKDKLYTASVDAFGSGEAGNIFVEVTYAEAAQLVNDSLLVPGTLYKITDRGDMGIILHAISANELSQSGIRIMLCPAYYGEGVSGGHTWIGVWHSSKSVNIDELAIWGGLVWKNLTGNIGSSLNDFGLDAINWEVISKADFIAAVAGSENTYVEKQFDVVYNFTTDWIQYQYDGFGNGVGFGADLIGYQPCDVTDWNSTANGGCNIFDNHTAMFGIFNNAGSNVEIANNFCKRIIGNNVQGPVGIFRNFSNDIMYNNNTGDIGLNLAPEIRNLPSTVTNVTQTKVELGIINGLQAPYSLWNGELRANMICLGELTAAQVNALPATPTASYTFTQNTLPLSKMAITGFYIYVPSDFVSATLSNFSITLNGTPSSFAVVGGFTAFIERERLLNTIAKSATPANMSIQLDFGAGNTQDYIAGSLKLIAVFEPFDLINTF